MHDCQTAAFKRLIVWNCPIDEYFVRDNHTSVEINHFIQFHMASVKLPHGIQKNNIDFFSDQNITFQGDKNYNGG